MDNGHRRGAKTAIITGISGQDGAYLAQFLLRKGYDVVATTRDIRSQKFQHLQTLNILDKIELRELAIADFSSVLDLCRSVRPDEIYHLSAQSSVAASFNEPHETIRAAVDATVNIAEAVRRAVPSARLFNATSSEAFGNTSPDGASEVTPFRPLSPYAVGKASAHMAVANYRDAFGLFCCSGILFNHESPLRAPRYVTRKIVEGARTIAEGSREPLKLGYIDIKRDWGLASEYVEAMWLMLQQPTPDDYVIATGKVSSLRDFLDEAFRYFGLRWQDHVLTDPALLRPQDITFSVGDPAKAYRELGWKARGGPAEIVASMAKSVEEFVSASQESPALMPEHAEASALSQADNKSDALLPLTAGTSTVPRS